VPWCDGCSRFWTVDAVAAQRTCPSCGDDLPEATAGDDVETPWHFKLLVVAVVAYLAWRAVQGVQWLVAHL
jgi:uncharacterized protein (DUF983 family)